MAGLENAKSEQALRIPDHELLRCIGRGGYGEVWLARNVMGTFRAVKIIQRKTFEEPRPFEREFGGIEKFEPICRTHPGFVGILHIGRNREEGYFYYVMEAADDVNHGQKIDPETYVPKTLGNELKRLGRIPWPDCLQISLTLTAALAHLHQQGLVHRDIKPSNIIFVRGTPKFADIGLVTAIGEASTYVGTRGFIAPEGPGKPAADLYSLGVLLSELVAGTRAADLAELPTKIEAPDNSGGLQQLREVILKACEPNVSDRFQTGDEMQAALCRIASAFPEAVSAKFASYPKGPTGSEAFLPTPVRGEAPLPGLQVIVLYKSNVPSDRHVLDLLSRRLAEEGCQVFFDKHLAIGVEWAREIETRIRQADAAIILLSPASIQSEMIAYEVEIADQAGQQPSGKPSILPVRINFTGPLPSSLASILDPLQYFLWESPQDDDRLIHELARALATSQKKVASSVRQKLESIGGAVPLDSRFYVVRPTDSEFQTAIARRDSIVLVKGARQMGKTSLLARGLRQARASNAQVVLTDFQKLNAKHLVSVEAFFLTLGDFLADQLNLDVLPEDTWDQRRSANTNFERYLRREVLAKISSHLVWGLDEVDRLFTCEFGSEVFGLFRSWHNERALDPEGPWSRLTLAIAYATEAHLFITDVNQSPFNVGTRLTLDDFTMDQVSDLNQRYGDPLKSAADLRRFFSMVGGQPYLVRRSLNELASGHMTFAEFTAQVDRDEGMFGDHLRRILVLLAKDHELTETVRGILRGHPCGNATNFYRLRSAGVMAGDSPQQIRPRCEIYVSYLKRHLL